jgi:hypothetical protein
VASTAGVLRRRSASGFGVSLAGSVITEVGDAMYLIGWLLGWVQNATTRQPLYKKSRHLGSTEFLHVAFWIPLPACPSLCVCPWSCGWLKMKKGAAKKTAEVGRAFKTNHECS